jgi:hypothetical protein
LNQREDLEVDSPVVSISHSCSAPFSFFTP